MYKYHSDQPIGKKDEDEFNRGVFVTDFIEILSDFEDNENYIVSLFAKWGQGKTSTVNMILNELKEKDEFCEVYLSAWTFGGDYEKIIWDILDQTSKKIMKKKVRTKRSRFGSWMSRVSKAELPFELETKLDLNRGGREETQFTTGRILNTVNYMSQILASSDNIEKARKRVEESIGSKKVVVFIDDLDRLEGKQIIDILRAINTVADYGGMTYVLPFDKRYVCDAIEECLPKNYSGDEFIEKIIQVPIDLPDLTRSTIDKVMINKINGLINTFQISLDEDEVTRFQQLYFNEVNKYITSPRDINKIMNTFRFKFPIIIGELNTVDAIIIEIIRVFDEPLYSLIKNNNELLIKNVYTTSQKYFMDDKHQQRKEDANLVFQKLSVGQLHIIQELFPVIDEIYNNRYFSDANELRRKQRISSEKYFDLYFSSLDESEGISDRKLIKILQLEDPTDLKEQLKRVLNQKNFDIALRIIVDNVDKILCRRELCKALLDKIETFPERDNSTGFSLSMLDTLIFRIDDILEMSITKLEDYIALLNHCYSENRLETLVLLVKHVNYYSGQSKSEKEIDFSEEEIDIYMKRVLEIIRELSEKNKIPINAVNKMPSIYPIWQKIGDKSEVQGYIEKSVLTANQAIDFISQFLGRYTELGKNDYRRGDFDNSTYKILGEFLDFDYFYSIILKDNQYSNLLNIKQENVPSLENRYDSNGKKDNFSKVGNEHNKEFREIVASQFIYIHENK